MSSSDDRCWHFGHYAVASVAIFILALFVECMVPEASVIADTVKANPADELKLSAILPGRWDTVCYLTELMKPEDVVREAGIATPTLAKLGNGYRNILVDGETGVLAINHAEQTYANFLVFDANRISLILHDGDPECFDLSRAVLRKVQLDPSWTHFLVSQAR